MSETSRPWVGRIASGALGDAGPYSADQWRETWRNIIGTGATELNRAVMRGVESELEVVPNSPTAKNVLVEAGAALVAGCFYLNDPAGTGEQVDIDDNASGSTRLDIIILELDYTNQIVRLDVLKGTPGAGLPSLTQSLVGIYQVPLAYITLASGYTTITASMITDLRQYANIPDALGYLATNSSGGTLEGGSVVVPSGTQGFTTSTSVTALPAGILESRTINGAIGRVITHGIFTVICEASVSAGDFIGVASTAGQAETTSAFAFARVLVANTGAGTKALCYISVPAFRKPPACHVYHNANQATGVGSFLAFNSELYDNASMHDTVTDNSRITFTVPGIYRISARFHSNVANMQVQIVINGGNFIDLAFTTGVGNAASLSASYSFSAGDYIQVQVQSVATIVAANFYSPQFSAEWVSAI